MDFNLIKKNKVLALILVTGLFLRLLFILYGAEIYFNRTNIHIDGDTWAWQNCIENLINNGTFTVGGDNGQFSRMPGYPFFMGVFYTLCNQNWDIAVIIIAWFQVIIDVISIYLIYRITILTFNNKKTSLIASFLYSTYPFVIVWNPVCYAEVWSTFLMLLSLVLFFKSFTNSSKKSLFFSGFVLGLCALTRPQLIPLFPILALVVFIINKKNLKIALIKSSIISLSFISIFALWPVRNYLNHNRLIITKNAEGFMNWQDDVISFMQYTYAVKSEWDPQYTSIIKNQKTTYPKVSYCSIEDSLKLEKAIYLSKNCGGGFSRKKGYWKAIVKEDNCNEEIKKLFTELRENQIKLNPINFYLIVPLQNLKKAIFKNRLYDDKSIQRKAASLLFYVRTFLILCGIVGALFCIRIKDKFFGLIILLFFMSVYFTLSFGTSPFMRNIEIRYFLQTDILLLISSSILFEKLSNILNVRKNLFSQS